MQSNNRLVLINPEVAATKVRSILHSHINSLARYVAVNRVNRAEASKNSLFSTENFVYKVLVPAAALFAGQEYLVNATLDPAIVTSMRDLVAEKGYIDGIAEYVSNHAFRHSSFLLTSQDLTLTGILTALVAKVTAHGYDRKIMQLSEVSNEAFKQIATDIFYRYNELAANPDISELAAFKTAFDECSEVIEELQLDPDQKQRLMSMIGRRLTPAVEFHRKMETMAFGR